MPLFLLDIRTIYSAAGFVAILAMAIIVLFVDATVADKKESANKQVLRSFRSEVGRDLVINEHGVYDVDFVKVGNCSIEKRKLGPLSLGGLNILVLKDVSIVIPNDNEKIDKQENEQDAVIDHLGVPIDYLKRSVGELKFSGLKIERLEISALNASSDVIPRMTAERAVAKKDGLELEGCVILNPDVGFIGKAYLKAKPTLSLVWNGKIMNLKEGDIL